MIRCNIFLSRTNPGILVRFLWFLWICWVNTRISSIHGFVSSSTISLPLLTPSVTITNITMKEQWTLRDSLVISTEGLIIARILYECTIETLDNQQKRFLWSFDKVILQRCNTSKPSCCYFALTLIIRCDTVSCNLIKGFKF